jgi:hypothetical protein
MLDEIEKFVGAEIKKLDKAQLETLKALLYGGYKGERDYVLEELLEGKIEHSPLTESFEYTFEDERVRYSRIKPEYYRAVRKMLFKGKRET